MPRHGPQPGGSKLPRQGNETLASQGKDWCEQYDMIPTIG